MNKKKLDLPKFASEKHCVVYKEGGISNHDHNHNQTVAALIEILNKDIKERAQQMKEQTEYYARNNRALKIKSAALIITTLVTVLGVTIGSMKSLLSFDKLSQDVKKTLELYIDQLGDLKTFLKNELGQNLDQVKIKIQEIGNDFEEKFSDIKIENKEIFDSFNEVKNNINNITKTVENLDRKIQQADNDFKDLKNDVEGLLEIKRKFDAFFTPSNYKPLNIGEAYDHLVDISTLPQHFEDSRLVVEDNVIEESIHSQARSKRFTFNPFQPSPFINRVPPITNSSPEKESGKQSIDQSSKIKRIELEKPNEEGKTQKVNDQVKNIESTENESKILLKNNLFEIKKLERNESNTIKDSKTSSFEKKSEASIEFINNENQVLKVAFKSLESNKENLSTFLIDLRGKDISHIPYEKVMNLDGVNRENFFVNTKYIDGFDRNSNDEKHYPFNLSCKTNTFSIKNSEPEISNLVYFKKYSLEGRNFIELTSHEIKAKNNNQKELHESTIKIELDKNVTLVDNISNEEEIKVFSYWIELIDSIDNLNDSEIDGDLIDKDMWKKFVNIIDANKSDEIKNLMDVNLNKNIDPDLLKIKKHHEILGLFNDYEKFIEKNASIFTKSGNNMLIDKVNFYTERSNNITDSILDQYTNINNTDKTYEAMLGLDSFLESNIGLGSKERAFDVNIIEALKSKDNMSKFGYVGASMSLILSVLGFHTVIFDYLDRRRDKKKTTKAELVRAQIGWSTLTLFGIISLFLTGGLTIPIVVPSIVFSSFGLLIDWRQRSHYDEIHYIKSKMSKILNHSKEIFEILGKINDLEDSDIKAFKDQFDCMTDNIYNKLLTIEEQKVNKNDKKIKKILVKKNSKILETKNVYEIFIELNKLSILFQSLKLQIDQIGGPESKHALKKLKSVIKNIVKIILNGGWYDKVIDDIIFIKISIEQIAKFACEDDVFKNILAMFGNGKESFIKIKEDFSRFIDLKNGVEKSNQKEKKHFFRSIRLIKYLSRLKYTDEKKKLKGEQEDLQKNALREIPRIVNTYITLRENLEIAIGKVKERCNEANESQGLTKILQELEKIKIHCRERIHFYGVYLDITSSQKDSLENESTDAILGSLSIFDTSNKVEV